MRHQSVYLFPGQFQRIQFVQQTKGRGYDTTSTDASNLKKRKIEHIHWFSSKLVICQCKIFAENKIYT